MPARELLDGPAAAPAARGADAEATGFTELFQAHFQRVYMNLRRLGVPESAVDDALQEVFLVVLRRRGESPLHSERAWILGVVRRIAHRWRRGAARQRRLAEALTHEPREVVDGVGAVAQRQATALLAGFLEQLDDDRREVFVLAELEQMTAPEIAEALALNINTVYSRLRAARQLFDRSFARVRLREARTVGEASSEVVLLSRARSAYLPGPGAQARALAMLAPWLLLPGAAQASSLTAELPLLSAAPVAASGSPAVAVGTWAIWTAALGLVGVVAAGAVGGRRDVGAGVELVDRTEARATRPDTGGEAGATADERGAARADDARASARAESGVRPRRDARARPGSTEANASSGALTNVEPQAATISTESPGEERSPSVLPDTADPLQREAALLARARTALRVGDAPTAQALLERHAREFPDGALTDERRLSQISALCLSGQVLRARAEAQQLARERPGMATRAALLCGEISATDAASAGD